MLRATEKQSIFGKVVQSWRAFDVPAIKFKDARRTYPVIISRNCLDLDILEDYTYAPLPLLTFKTVNTGSWNVSNCSFVICTDNKSR